MNGFTWICYMAIQAFLVDACILRDYLAEYAARFVFDQNSGPEHPLIATMAGLRKKLLNKANAEDPLVYELQTITDDEGWLKKLGAYRDLVVHSAPLLQAEGQLSAVKGTVKTPIGEIPFIHCPIPRNPEAIKKHRSNGSIFQNFEDQLKRFVEASMATGDNIDGLEYCHKTLGQISRLADRLAHRSPVEPQIPAFDESDLIGEIKILPD